MPPPNNPDKRKKRPVERRNYYLSAPTETSLSIPLLNTYAGQWVYDSRIRRHTEATITNNRTVIKQLVWWMAHERIGECNTATLRCFFEYLAVPQAGRWGKSSSLVRLKPATSQSYYQRLHTFFTFLKEQDIILIHPMDRIKKPICRQSQIIPLTMEQVQAVLDACVRTPQPERNRAIILVLIDTGLRNTELCNLRMSDVDLNAHRITVLGKGGKTRSVFMDQKVVQAIRKYLRVKPHGNPDDALFCAWSEIPNSYPALTRSGLTQLCRRLGKLADITAVRCSPHTFRHTFGIELTRNGANPFCVQFYLGHTTLNMTKRYIAYAATDAENQHRLYSPAAKLK